ncbi:hypothetical protein GF312_02115 [Candidatus Poribacteria bacterium]|nr:hypothetical protein [Candidatus Poribacteria bacterium]
MQYGNLNSLEIAEFNAYRSSSLRKPTYTLWIAGYGDLTEEVISIEQEITLADTDIINSIYIGKAVVCISNKGLMDNGIITLKPNAEIRIWGGFNGVNVPIYTGIIDYIKSSSTDGIIFLHSTDYMSLFKQETIGRDIFSYNTPELIAEYFCKFVNIPEPLITNSKKTDTVYRNKAFLDQSMYQCLESICQSIFYVGYFNENGILNLTEHNHYNYTDFVFNDSNVIDCGKITDTNIINHVELEYAHGASSDLTDQISVDTYGTGVLNRDISMIDYTIVSNEVTESGIRELENDLEAFRFTSSPNSSFIDCIKVRIGTETSHGNISVGIYEDAGGIPGNLIAESLEIDVLELSSEFAWVAFRFVKPVKIQPDVDYWVVIDISLITAGSVYVRINDLSVTSDYAYYSGTWQIINDIKALHIIIGSYQGYRMATDILNFHSDNKDSIFIKTPFLPHLQLMDKVFVDIQDRGITGQYKITGCKHEISSGKYITWDFLRKIK